MSAEATTGFHPNMKDVPEDKTGLFCFKDASRMCGADCMAYVDAPEGPDYVGKQWARCHLLVNQHRTGKHLVVITGILDKIEKKFSAASADARRANQTPLPRPNG